MTKKTAMVFWTAQKKKKKQNFEVICELFCPSLNIHGSLEMGAGMSLPWWPTLCVTWEWVSVATPSAAGLVYIYMGYEGNILPSFLSLRNV